MNITHLTYEYDVYYKSEKLDNILDMEYKVLASTIGGNYYIDISITYIDSNGYIKHINCDSRDIKFEKRNKSTRPCFAKEEE